MATIPIRCAARGVLDASIRDIRQMVADAREDQLRLDPAAVEILSTLSGKTLTAASRRALHDSLTEVLKDGLLDAGDTGPLGDTDVLGVIVGLAQFVLQIKGAWLFVRIPEQRSQKTPDIYALADSNRRPWYLELKGVAPLSSRAQPARRLQTCKSVDGQFRKAKEQLEASLVQPPPGAPAVRVSSGNIPSLLGDQGQDRKAVSVVVLPDGNLVERGDIPATGQAGCPNNCRCADRCLKSHVSDFKTSAVGLLWYQQGDNGTTSPSDGIRSDPVRQLLAAVEAANAAVWANSHALADDAVQAIGSRLVALGGQVDEPVKARLLFRSLVSTRSVTSREARQTAAEALIQRSTLRDSQKNSLLREASRCALKEVPRIEWASIELDRMHGQVAEVHIGSSDHGGAGLLGEGILQIAPSIRMLDAALHEGTDHLLRWAAATLQHQILPKVIGRPGPIHEGELRAADISLGEGDTRWSVGYRWDDSRANRAVAGMLHTLSARREYEKVMADFRHGDVDALYRWACRHQAELAQYWHVDEQDMRPLLDLWRSWWLREGYVLWRLLSNRPQEVPFLPWFPFGVGQGEAALPSAWAAFNGRIQVRW